MVLNPYEKYALATEAPNIFADIIRRESQQRTGDLAKNMFAQLQGMDPASKEYFQKMKQFALESGDDALFGMGQQQNQAQQGYAFDNPLYTSDVKEYILTTGDTELQNPAALDAFIQRANASKSTRVSVNMPAFPVGTIGTDISEDYIDPRTGLPVTPGTPIDEFRRNVAAGDAIYAPKDDQDTIKNVNTALKLVEGLEESWNAATATRDKSGTIIGGLRNLKNEAVANYGNAILDTDEGKVRAYNANKAAILSAVNAALGGAKSMSDTDTALLQQTLAEVGTVNPLNADSSKAAERKFKMMKGVLKAVAEGKGGKPGEKVSYIDIIDPKTRKPTGQKIRVVAKKGEDGKWITVSEDKI